MTNELNPTKLKNVVLAKKVQDLFTAIDKEPRVIEPLAGAIFNLAVEKPLWIFEATNVSSSKGIENFNVSQDGEKLGQIGLSYYRGKYCIAVSNDRIANARDRTSSYRTADISKAVLMIKKMFARKNTSERIGEAYNNAKKVLVDQKWQRDRIIRADESIVSTAQLLFAQGVGYAMFIEHIKSHNNTKVLQALEAVEVNKVDMVSIEAIQSKFEAMETALVIKSDGKYIVKVKQKVDICEDHDLPDNIRGKLAMLKLVDKEHIVSGMGCRINEEVFVILLEEPNEIQSATGI